MRSLLITFLCLGTIISLSACGNILTNNALTPPAYKYHNTEFRSRDGEPAADIGYTYSRNINNKSLEIWDNITNDLVIQMEKHYNMVAQPIYLQPHSENTLFLNSYDFALRKALLKKNYDLMLAPQNAANLYYEAKPIKNEDSQSRLQEIEFILTIVYDNKITDQMHHIDTLPKFYNRFETEHDYLTPIKNMQKNIYWKKTTIENMPKSDQTLNANRLNGDHNDKPNYMDRRAYQPAKTISIPASSVNYTTPRTQLMKTEDIKKQQDALEEKVAPYLHKDSRQRPILDTTSTPPNTGPYPPSWIKKSTE